MEQKTNFLRYFRINRLLQYIVLCMVFPSIAWPANMAGGVRPEDLPGSVRPVSPSGHLAVREMHAVAGSDGAVLQEVTGLAEVLGDAGSLIGSQAGSDGSERSSIQSTTATESKADSPERGSPVADGDQEAFATPQKASAPPSPPSGPLFEDDDAEEGDVENPPCWQRCYRGLIRLFYGAPAPAPVSSTVPAVEMVSAKVGTVPNPLRKRLKDGEVDPRHSLALVMARSHIHGDADAKADAKGGRPSIAAYGPQPSMRTMERRSALAKTYGPRRSTVAGLQETLAPPIPGGAGSPGVVSNPLNVGAAGVREVELVAGHPKNPAGATAPGGGEADELEGAEAGARAKPAKPEFTPEEEAALRAFSNYVTTSVFPDKPSWLEVKRRFGTGLLTVVLAVGLWGMEGNIVDLLLSVPRLAAYIATPQGFQVGNDVTLAIRCALPLIIPYVLHILHSFTGYITSKIEQKPLIKPEPKINAFMHTVVGIYAFIKGAVPTHRQFVLNINFPTDRLYALIAPWGMGAFTAINAWLLAIFAHETQILPRTVARDSASDGIRAFRIKLGAMVSQINRAIRNKTREEVMALEERVKALSRQAARGNMKDVPIEELPGIVLLKELMEDAAKAPPPPKPLQALIQGRLQIVGGVLFVLYCAVCNAILNYTGTLAGMESIFRSLTQGHPDESYYDAAKAVAEETDAQHQAVKRQGEENAISTARIGVNDSLAIVADLAATMVPDDEYYLGNYADPCYRDFSTAIVFPDSTPPTNDDPTGMTVQFRNTSSLGKPFPYFEPFNYTGFVPYPFTMDPSIDGPNGYSLINCLAFNDYVLFQRENPSDFYPYPDPFFWGNLTRGPYGYLAIPNNGTAGYTLGNLTTVNNVTTPVVEPLAPWAEGLSVTAASGSAVVTAAMSAFFLVKFVQNVHDLFAKNPVKIRPGGAHRGFNAAALTVACLAATVLVSESISDGLLEFSNPIGAGFVIAGALGAGIATLADGFVQSYAAAFGWMQRGWSYTVWGVRKLRDPDAVKPLFREIKRAKLEGAVDRKLASVVSLGTDPLITGLGKFAGIPS